MRNRVYVLKKFRATSPGNPAHLMDRLGPSDLFGNSKSSVTVGSFYRVFSFMMDHGNFGSMLIDCITYRLGVRSLIWLLKVKKDITVRPKSLTSGYLFGILELLPKIPKLKMKKPLIDFKMVQ